MLLSDEAGLRGLKGVYDAARVVRRGTCGEGRDLRHGRRCDRLGMAGNAGEPAQEAAVSPRNDT